MNYLIKKKKKFSGKKFRLKMLNLVIFLIVLGILIFVHEFGHFIVAKKSRVPVEEFAVGFPPKLYSKKIGDTIYSLNLILFGGYVRIKGENNPADPTGFLNQPPYKKLLITFSGVFFNLILAYFIFSIGYLYGLPEYSKEAQNVTITQILPNSPAQKAGLKLGDKILYLKVGNNILEIKKPEELKKNVGPYIGKEIILGIERGTEKFELKIIPQEGEAPIGIGIASIGLIKYKFPTNFYQGLIKTYDGLKAIIFAFKDFFARLLKERKVAKEVVGPLGIYDIYNQMKTLGINYLLHFIAVISLNLFIINLIPFPGLDGGRLIIYFGEAISRKKFPYIAEIIINSIGLALLIVLMILITIKDILVKIKK
ncbi:MAG: M50 family metallopeptidase [Candidatus Aenigmatarchaeota archaeon]